MLSSTHLHNSSINGACLCIDEHDKIVVTIGLVLNEKIVEPFSKIPHAPLNSHLDTVPATLTYIFVSV